MNDIEMISSQTPNLSSSSRIFVCTRPKNRLWVAECSGRVHSTLKLADAGVSDLGHIGMLDDKTLLSWNIGRHNPQRQLDLAVISLDTVCVTQTFGVRYEPVTAFSNYTIMGGSWYREQQQLALLVAHHALTAPSSNLHDKTTGVLAIYHITVTASPESLLFGQLGLCGTVSDSCSASRSVDSAQFYEVLDQDVFPNTIPRCVIGHWAEQFPWTKTLEKVDTDKRQLQLSATQFDTNYIYPKATGEPQFKALLKSNSVYVHHWMPKQARVLSSRIPWDVESLVDTCCPLPVPSPTVHKRNPSSPEVMWTGCLSLVSMTQTLRCVQLWSLCKTKSTFEIPGTLLSRGPRRSPATPATQLSKVWKLSPSWSVQNVESTRLSSFSNCGVLRFLVGMHL